MSPLPKTVLLALCGFDGISPDGAQQHRSYQITGDIDCCTAHVEQSVDAENDHHTLDRDAHVRRYVDQDRDADARRAGLPMLDATSVPTTTEIWTAVRSTPASCARNRMATA